MRCWPVPVRSLPDSSKDYKLKTETNCHFLVNQTTLMEQSTSSKVSTDITKMFSLLDFLIIQVSREMSTKHAIVKSFIFRAFWKRSECLHHHHSKPCQKVLLGAKALKNMDHSK